MMRAQVEDDLTPDEARATARQLRGDIAALEGEESRLIEEIEDIQRRFDEVRDQRQRLEAELRALENMGF